MKKILLTSLAALALASCVSDNDLNPAAEEQQYGYINFNLSNDPSMTTRTTLVDDSKIADWIISAESTTAGGQTYTDLDNTTNNKVVADEYKFIAKNYASEEDATNMGDEEHGYWGDAYYSNEDNPVTEEIVPGVTGNDETIACGRPKNTRVKVNIPTIGSSSPIGISSFQVDKNIKAYETGTTVSTKYLSFNADTDKPVYYKAETTVNYKLVYTYNGSTKDAVEGTIKTGVAGTEHIIDVIAGTDGQIKISITCEGFTTGTNKKITIDALSGNYKEETIEPTPTPEEGSESQS